MRLACALLLHGEMAGSRARRSCQPWRTRWASYGVFVLSSAWEHLWFAKKPFQDRSGGKQVIRVVLDATER
jgi:hypothetical protein